MFTVYVTAYNVHEPDASWFWTDGDIYSDLSRSLCSMVTLPTITACVINTQSGYHQDWYSFVNLALVYIAACRSWFFESVRVKPITYATFTLCSRRPRQSRFRPPWSKRDGCETTRGDGMDKRDRPWLPWMPGQIFKLSKNLPRQPRCVWET